jgi:flagellar M-ring protein FliF
VRHVIENPGQVRRMTAAIVVNDRMAQAAVKGKAAEWKPRTAGELSDLTALAQAAVGYNPARGDLLTVQDLAFDENRSVQAESLPSQVLKTAESSPLLVKYAALLAGLLLVVAFGVRPALRYAGSSSKAAKGAPKELPGRTAVASIALKPPEPTEVDPERVKAQQIFEEVSDHLKREPTQSSRLLQSWIHSD